MSDVQRISKDQLIAMFIGNSDVIINGNTFINIETMTEVKNLIKPKSNPYNGLKKLSVANVQIFQNKNGSSYEAKVKRDLAKEGKDPESFQVQERTWGERVKNTPVIFHKGEFYLEVIYNNQVGDTKYFFEGEEVSKDTVKPHIRPSSGGKQGGLEKKVIIRSFKASSITAITINKQKYVVM